jgi:hypothetical protein
LRKALIEIPLAAKGINLHIGLSVVIAEELLVELLQSRPTQKGSAVVMRGALIQLLLRDLPEISQDVGGEGIVWVEAQGVAHNIDAGEKLRTLPEARPLGKGQVAGQRHGDRAAQPKVEATFKLLHRDFEDVGERSKRVLEARVPSVGAVPSIPVSGIQRIEGQRECGAIPRENTPMPVQDLTARSREDLGTNPRASRALPKLASLESLKEKETAHQHGIDDENDGNENPGSEFTRFRGGCHRTTSVCLP